MFSLFAIFVTWFTCQHFKDEAKLSQTKLEYEKMYGLGENLELEEELGVQYYKEMEQTFRDEFEKNNYDSFVAFDKMLEIHFPRALKNSAYRGNDRISVIAAAKARLEVWERGYKLTNSLSREYPPTDKILLMASWHPSFVRESGAEPIDNYWSCDIETITKYPHSDKYPTLDKWIKKLEKDRKKKFGRGYNCELEQKLSIQYYKEMEQCYRDELQYLLDNLDNKEEMYYKFVDKAYDKMLEKHFPRALNNPIFFWKSIKLAASAKGRLEVWKQGYTLTGTDGRENPPTDKILCDNSHFAFNMPCFREDGKIFIDIISYLKGNEL